MKNVKKVWVIGLIALLLGSCGLVTSEKKDMDPKIQQDEMSSEDPGNLPPDRDP
jgi:PBP1b-binding outer membrane lipoprotein LpoB